MPRWRKGAIARVCVWGVSQSNHDRAKREGVLCGWICSLGTRTQSGGGEAAAGVALGRCGGQSPLGCRWVLWQGKSQPMLQAVLDTVRGAS